MTYSCTVYMYMYPYHLSIHYYMYPYHLSIHYYMYPYHLCIHYYMYPCMCIVHVIILVCGLASISLLCHIYIKSTHSISSSQNDCQTTIIGTPVITLLVMSQCLVSILDYIRCVIFYKSRLPCYVDI